MRNYSIEFVKWTHDASPVTPQFKGKSRCISYTRQIEIHTCNKSVYRDECHQPYYITRMSYKITDNRIKQIKILSLWRHS
jgi:hypothetical protein